MKTLKIILNKEILHLMLQNFVRDQFLKNFMHNGREILLSCEYKNLLK